MANKLHELLAVEADRKHKAVQAIGEARKTFTKQDVQFDGMVKKYVPLEENAEQIPDEVKEIVLTVPQKLRAMREIVTAGLDANLSKEETNAAHRAKAELKVGETDFGELSATSLLALESQLSRLRELYANLPTLDHTKRWEFDAQNNVYRTPVEVKFRSVKRPKVIVKYEATEKHPAQTELMQLNFQVGKYETTYTSGRVSSAQKATLLKRLDTLLEAIKVARAKANQAEVKNIKLADKIFDFLHKDVIEG